MKTTIPAYETLNAEARAHVDALVARFEGGLDQRHVIAIAQSEVDDGKALSIEDALSNDDDLTLSFAEFAKIIGASLDEVFDLNGLNDLAENAITQHSV
ncbi:MAG: hypothetical protein KKH61_21235 [Gammaproteobacteria bacterium]|uniref:Uncharacterized protein n=1 Tax=viral metagenome TaxID=1070528 RepID=A0A6H1ZAS0_9ZZZZ|nr:hypothetical protein [Gammaproteobacteria bacterium]